MKLITELCHLERKKIILASRSPRRIDLLCMVGLEFEVHPSEVEDAPAVYGHPAEYARQTALSKLNWVWEHANADLVISADTIVVQNGKILEKPGDRADGFRMLQTLSGATHRVITAFCLRSAAQTVVDHETSEVTFHPLSDVEIETYLASGEPYDKAGAYGIQGLGAIFIKKVDGCYFNVMGFPLGRFYQHLKKIEI